MQNVKCEKRQSRVGLLSHQHGFSLAEVLITLGIIGVVASLTLPTLINNIQDAQYKTAYKRAYSIGQQALTQANQDGLIVATPDINDVRNKDNFLAFMSEFKVSKECLNGDNSQCWNRSGEFYGVFGPPINSLAFVDTSGTAWAMLNTTAANILIDTNGSKNPNQFGKDRFIFSVCEKFSDGFLSAACSTSYVNIQAVIKPFPDNLLWGTCPTTNKCGNSSSPDYKTYFGTSWLYK